MKMNHESIDRVLATLSFALCLFLCAVPVKAETVIIDFSGQGGGAQLSFNQTTHVLTGSNIVISLLTGYNTPLNEGGHTVTGNHVIPSVGSFGNLSFTTPALSQVGGQWVYSGAEAGSYTINGKVPDAGINSIVPLLLGQISYIMYNPFSSMASVTFAIGDDTKNAQLLTYFGLTPGTGFTLEGSISASYDSRSNTWFTSSDIINSAPVPEPTSLILLGIGLLATYGFLGRIKK